MIKNNFILTFDVDWAPDFIIEEIASLLIKKKIKATWFVTHSSPAIDKLRERNNIFELGIHPNFLPNSSQGNSPEEVLKYTMSIVPEAVSSRAHAVVQSGPLLNMMVEKTNIRIDSTIFLPEMPNIRPVVHLTLTNNLIRIPFFWADDYEMMKQNPKWDISQYQNISGLKVMMFHPIHLFLNSNNVEKYNQFKKEVKDARNASPEQLNRFIHHGNGTKTFFNSIVEWLSREEKSYKIKELL